MNSNPPTTQQGKIILQKSYEPKKVENKIYNLWLKSGFFNPDKLPKRHKKPYCIVIPPPNITGSLHMGHALNAIVQDILIRWRRLQGYKTLWLPGTDHAGIATQNVVERELKKEGKTRFDLGREKFIERIWQWKKKYGDIILEQLKKMGASCDWSRTRFTMDKNYSLAVKEAFLHYYKKGWIYRGKRVINWCPRCQTFLSDLEIEYREERGKLWYVKYPLAKISNSQFLISKQIPNLKSQIPKFITVATTRPETMLGDTAVAVNPRDIRYKNLVGKEVILPLVKRVIPIITDKLVDSKFGTGAVKVTPAHDLIDYEISLRHNLPIIQVINEKAEITKEAPLSYQGLKVLEAREKIVDDLKKFGFLEKIEDYTISYPKCYRCGTTIELIPSEQWFLKMADLAKMAANPVKKGKIKFHPKSFEKSYFDWLKNIKDWCISRQIWWGHQLPVYVKQEEIKNQKSKIKNNLEIQNSKLKIYVGNNPPKNYIQVPDVLDTWFSAALWPFATLEWPSAIAKIKNKKSPKESKLPTEQAKIKNDLARFYPTDVLSTDRGIINLWVARMIFSGMEFMKKIPFKDVYIHATVLTREGKRMSKSLGTGIDPINFIEKYGADATRFGISYQIMGGQDIRFVEDNILMGKKFCNKIWNAARFLLIQKPPLINANSLRRFSLIKKNLTQADKKILKALDKTKKSVNRDLENFRFGQAAHKLYDFFWHDFCDKYIEESKKQLKTANIKRQTSNILLYVLLTSLKLLHPFIPFITEEIYQKLPLKEKKECLMIEEWPL